MPCSVTTKSMSQRGVDTTSRRATMADRCPRDRARARRSSGPPGDSAAAIEKSAWPPMPATTRPPTRSTLTAPSSPTWSAVLHATKRGISREAADVVRSARPAPAGAGRRPPSPRDRRHPTSTPASAGPLEQTARRRARRASHRRDRTGSARARAARTSPRRRSHRGRAAPSRLWAPATRRARRW